MTWFLPRKHRMSARPVGSRPTCLAGPIRRGQRRPAGRSPRSRMSIVRSRSPSSPLVCSAKEQLEGARRAHLGRQDRRRSLLRHAPQAQGGDLSRPVREDLLRLRCGDRQDSSRLGGGAPMTPVIPGSRVHGVRDRPLYDSGPTDPSFARNPPHCGLVDGGARSAYGAADQEGAVASGRSGDRRGRRYYARGGFGALEGDRPQGPSRRQPRRRVPAGGIRLVQRDHVLREVEGGGARPNGGDPGRRVEDLPDLRP